jgi:hypothetical protein
MSDKDMFDEAFPQDKQIGGSHYQQFIIQPWTFIRKNGLNPFQANVIKYVCRYLKDNRRFRKNKTLLRFRNRTFKRCQKEKVN